MVQIIGVRFKKVGKVYHFDPAGVDVKAGDTVIVETSRGIEMGEVVVGVHEADDDIVKKPLRPVLRLATEDDFRVVEENKKKEAEAFALCNEKIAKHGLEMKLVEVEYTFDNSKILFYFTADGRIDFRELVKELANVYRTRIELRQIGARDESKTLGSISICGRELCCAQFLGEFEPVSIKMAKEQGLSLNPTKISGTCGRLMCCLKFEQDTYEELLQVTPRQGSVVETPDGIGTVEYVSLLKGQLKVGIENDREKVHKDYAVDEVKVIKKPKSDRFLEKNDEELLKGLED
ncbi:MAG: stage 0 sporulation family protein [Eubacteriales bacterium]|nr:stage 0 sporulation family protein [Eubacteriales bacterium]